MHQPGSLLAIRSLCRSVLYLFLLPLFCAGIEAQQTTDTITIVGQLTVARVGPPPMRVLVKLERSGAQAGETYTDGEGKFSFEDEPPNLYRIIIQQQGYRAVDESVPINSSVQHTVYLRIELDPEDKTGNGSQTTVNGANGSMVDEAALADKFPKEAKKQYEKARKAERDGKSEEAIEHYEKALATAPTMYFARNNLGSLYLEKQRFPDAEKEFTEAIAENPADANAYFNLANVYLLTNRLGEASDSIEQGLKRQPQSAFGQFLMGSVLMKRGNAPEAEKRLRTALNEDPGMANAHLALVNLYLRENRSAEAITELSVFLKQSPDSPFAPHARELLGKLHAKNP
jgi:tetratricopeptide (TPR) repeat protein